MDTTTPTVRSWLNTARRGWLSGASWARGAWSSNEGPSLGLLGVSLVAVILSWHIPTTDPNSLGGDRDFWYQMGLSAERGVDFGTALATSYGPLYFLTAPSITHPLQVAIAFACWIVFTVSAVAALAQTRHSRWAVPLIIVLAISIAATPASAVVTSMPVLLFTLSLAESQNALPRWMHRAFPIYAAVFISFLSLNKFSTAAMSAIAVLAALLTRDGKDRWIALAKFVATGAVVVIALWLLTKQPLLSLPEYVIRGLIVGSGYGGGLGLELNDNLWEYLFAALGVIAMLVLLIQSRPRKGVALDIVWVILTFAPVWLLLKQGFMRHDSHSAQFFALTTSAMAYLAYVGQRRFVASLAVFSLVLQVGIFGKSFASVDPAARATDFGRSLASTYVPSVRAERLATARKAIKQEARVPASMVTLIGKQTVYLEPFNGSIPFAYRLNSATIPTILEYGAYNPELDRINSHWFEDPQTAPQFILRRKLDFTVDYRNPLWDSPNAKLQEICRYAVVASQDEWLLLQRRPASVCGTPAPLGATTTVPAGTSYSVPVDPSALTVVRLTPRTSFIEDVQATLFKPPPLMVTQGSTSYRLPWGDADAPLIVSGYTYKVGRTASAPATITVNVDCDVTVERVPISSTPGS